MLLNQDFAQLWLQIWFRWGFYENLISNPVSKLYSLSAKTVMCTVLARFGRGLGSNARLKPCQIHIWSQSCTKSWFRSTANVIYLYLIKYLLTRMRLEGWKNLQKNTDTFLNTPKTGWTKITCRSQHTCRGAEPSSENPHISDIFKISKIQISKKYFSKKFFFDHFFIFVNYVIVAI